MEPNVQPAPDGPPGAVNPAIAANGPVQEVAVPVHETRPATEPELEVPVRTQPRHLRREAVGQSAEILRSDNRW